MQEAAKQQWAKKTAILKDNNLKLLEIFGAKLAKCPAALEKVQSHCPYQQIVESEDGWLYIRLTIHVWAVRSSIHKERDIQDCAAEKQFHAFEMSPNDSWAVTFRNGFDHQLVSILVLLFRLESA